ncbi:MAG: PVC-type heme-binding CxxCH protein [Gemmatimonadota bacterium]
MPRHPARHPHTPTENKASSLFRLGYLLLATAWGATACSDASRPAEPFLGPPSVLDPNHPSAWLGEGPRRLEVLVRTNAQDPDASRQITSRLMALLGRTGINVTHEENPGPPTTVPEGVFDVVLDGDGAPLKLPTDPQGWTDPQLPDRMRARIQELTPPDSWRKLEELEIPELRYTPPPVTIPTYDGRPSPPLLQEPFSPEESLKQWQVPPGFELHLFASEPLIVNPIAMAWDERGRLWVVETVDYPNRISPDGEGNDVIRILEDTTGDGRADTATVFAEGLSIPTGLVFVNGGVMVAAAPHFLFLQDTDGDDVADVREVVLSGWSTRDTHAGPSNLHYGFDNRIWGMAGTAGFQQGELRFGAGAWRMERDGSGMELMAPFTNNSWGLGLSEEFHVFGSTANNEHAVQVAIPQRFFQTARAIREADGVDHLPWPGGGGRKRLDGHYDIHPITGNIRQVDYQGGFTSAAGSNLYTARSFPREYWNRVTLVAEPTGNLLHQGVLAPAGSGFQETEGWNLMASADEWASPVHAQVGPDGAVWVADWYNFIIQHNPVPPGFQGGPGAAYETPLRDRHHGRIYRLVWRGAPEARPMALSRQRPEDLVPALTHPNLFWRLTAQRLLVERGEVDVLPELYGLLRGHELDELGLNPGAIHALWTLEGLGLLDPVTGDDRARTEAYLALDHPSASVRRNAVMALATAGPGLEQLYPALHQAGLLEDPDPGVRIQALLALAELPASVPVGRRLYELAQVWDEERADWMDDDWLPTALFLAALSHREGFLSAYGEEVGVVPFARLAGEAARGELLPGVDWSGPALDHREWDTLPVPALWTTTHLGHFFGVVWYRHEFQLREGAGGAAGTLGLSPITDEEVTYLNGVRLGATSGRPSEPREYEIPVGVLRAGRNVLAVEVTNLRRGGGIWGDPQQLFVSGPGFRVPLAGEWKARVASVWEGGRQPDFAPGTPFAQQFLRYYSPVGGLSGMRGVGDGGAGFAGGRPGGMGGAGGAADVTLALGTVAGENRYDRSALTARPGQRVALAFDNTDDMPHNVVLLAAGASLPAVGAALDAYVSHPSAVGADYIPPELQVLASSDMVNARESATLVFTAPAEPGEYLFVCTVPGHWQTMWGILSVQE